MARYSPRPLLVGEFDTTYPTPKQAENDTLGTTAGAVVRPKDWDLSPVDPQSFDPFEPPGRPAAPLAGTMRRSRKQPGEWEYPTPRIGEFPTTRPTPFQSENDLLGATPGAITMQKQWDLSPVDLQSFDPTEPPGRPVPVIPSNTILPVIAGTPQNGQTLTCSTGTWDGGGITYTYQWAAGGNAIAGATNPTLVLGAAQIGLQVTCRVFATNAAGQGSADALPTAAVVDVPPTNTVPPLVTGTTVTGNVLQCTNGTWTGSPTFALQWLRGANNRPGSTGNTITLSALDEGNMMSCRVTATNSGGSLPVVSNQVGPITPTAADPGDDETEPDTPEPAPHRPAPHRNGRSHR